MARHHASKHMKRQSMRSRYHEHSGEERHLHGLHDSKGHSDEHVVNSHHADHPREMMKGHYEGRMDRRNQEMMDAGMIHEDSREIANLPQHVEMKPYPKSYKYLPEDLDDTIRGIDRQIDYDDSKRNENFYPKKF